MAELTLTEKGTISHRARAMEGLKKLLKEKICL
jgi:XTP/dITP diphosphohydrolase